MAPADQPQVLAKDLKGVALYTFQRPYLHLDAAPFLAAYLLLAYRSLSHAYSGTLCALVFACK